MYSQQPIIKTYYNYIDNDNEYNMLNDVEYNYRHFLIQGQNAEWLFTMNDIVRTWDN